MHKQPTKEKLRRTTNIHEIPDGFGTSSTVPWSLLPVGLVGGFLVGVVATGFVAVGSQPGKVSPIAADSLTAWSQIELFFFLRVDSGKEPFVTTDHMAKRSVPLSSSAGFGTESQRAWTNWSLADLEQHRARGDQFVLFCVLEL
jgi:hypothetical protein